MSWLPVNNLHLVDTSTDATDSGLLPLRLLIRQAGGAGYLLFSEDLLQFVVRRQRAAEGYDSVDSSAAIQVLYVVVCCIYAGWYLASPRNRRVSGILFSNPMGFFVLYIVLCLISASWSVKPVYSAFMAFQCLAFLLLVVAALSEVDRRCTPQNVIEWTMLWAGWTTFWAVVFDARWFGVTYLLYPFRSARLATGVFFFPALYLCKRRLLGWPIAAFAMLSGARKNYWGILPGLLFGAVLGDRKSRVLAFVSIGAVVGSVVFLGAEDVVQNTLFRGKEGIGWEYTTGRDKMWTLGWELCVERPLTGYGFVTAEREVLSEMMGQSAHSMHNMLLSAFVGVGFLGPLLLSLFFLGIWSLCMSKAIPASWRFAFTATIVMTFVVAMTDPGLGGRVYGSWLPSVVMITMIVKLCKNSVQYRPPCGRPITPFCTAGRASH